ncbi:MAG TPA: glycoside hydrolase family 9 protein, partial [Terriglobia bacterium]|nr:glycoside hydrolase family 9 protein [Terriglobia bacterium]
MASYSRRNFIRRSMAGAAGFGAVMGAEIPGDTAFPKSSAVEDSQNPAEGEGIRLDAEEYFSAPGFSFLLFHNNYQVGFQGGLQMIQNGERILDSGDFYLIPKSGASRPPQSVSRRVVDLERSTATVEGEVGDLNYRLTVATDGKQISIRLQTGSPIDWSNTREAGFRIYIYPADYFKKSYQGEEGRGVFPRQYDGRLILCDKTHSLLIADSDAAHRFRVTRTDGTLRLADNRARSPQAWFSIEAPLTPATDGSGAHIIITPSLLPGWKMPPVIAISQLGYHPRQAKRVVIAAGASDELSGEIGVYRLKPNGGMKLVKAGACAPWGKFLRYHCATFDFTSVREPGLYKLVFRNHEAGPFRIDSEVYSEAWQPTLEYFLPIQMCHVKVQEGVRTWHGACHLDDALQAPAHKDHLDGYRQGNLDTRFSANQHIPGLNWGGWHDAGDHDLPAGSIAMTTLALAMAEEEFHPELDRTAIRRSERLVKLHVPDGKPDLMQQIEY